MTQEPRLTRKKFVPALLASAVLTISAAAAAAQSTTNREGPASSERGGGRPDDAHFVQKVIRLEHADAHEAAGVVQSVLGRNRGRIGVDARTNSIVISAAAEDVGVAVELLTQLDVPDTGEGESRSALIRLGRDAPEDLLELIHALISRRTRVAFDRGTGMLVLRGPAGEIEEVNRLIDALEKGREPRASGDRQALTVSLYFIKGYIGNDAQDAVSRSRAAAPGDGGSQRSPRDRQVWSRLDKPTKPRFARLALEKVLKSLSEAGQVNIAPIWDDLEEAGIGRDSPVTLDLPAEITVRKALETVLEQVGGRETKLGFSVSDGLVKIATRDLLDRDLYVGVYDVSDLLKTVPNCHGRHARPYDAVSSTAGGEGVGPGTYAGPRERPADELLELISSTVAPQTWRHEGGLADLAVIDGQLVVTQSEARHEVVRQLLRELSAQRARALSAATFIPLPALLKPAAAALARNGFQKASLLAPLAVRVQGDEMFAVEGRVEQPSGAVQIRVEGRAHRPGSGDIVELEVEAALIKDRSGATNRDVMFEIDSRLSVPLGDLVVLAASPGATDYGQAVALVVRVTAVE